MDLLRAFSPGARQGTLPPAEQRLPSSHCSFPGLPVFLPTARSPAEAMTAWICL